MKSLHHKVIIIQKGQVRRAKKTILKSPTEMKLQQKVERKDLKQLMIWGRQRHMKTRGGAGMHAWIPEAFTDVVIDDEESVMSSDWTQWSKDP